MPWFKRAGEREHPGVLHKYQPVEHAKNGAANAAVQLVFARWVFLPFLVLAVLSYAVLLLMLLFKQDTVDEVLRQRQHKRLQPAQADA